MFQGTFSGNNNWIKNLYVCGTENGYGNSLFGRCKSATITDLTVTGYVEGESNCGGILSSSSGGVQITNCVSYVNIVANNGGNIGGITGGIGSNSVVENCEFRGTINSQGSTNVGGIVGDSISATIRNCKNYGNITATNSVQDTDGAYTNNGTAGIVGCARNTVVQSCKNLGTINSTNMIFVGGIQAYTVNVNYFDTKILDCQNEGNINCSGSVLSIGGITGELRGSLINRCLNKGRINAENDNGNHYLYLGGIVGDANTSSAVLNSFNDAELQAQVNAELCLGGVVGMQNTGYIVSCYNKGDVKGKSQTNNYIGGDIGVGSLCTVRGVYNTGTVSICNGNTAAVKIGGILGSCSNLKTSSNAYNFGQIVVPTSSNNIGGTFGVRTNSNSTTITDFYYENGVYSGSLYDSSVAQGVNSIDKTTMVSGMNTAAETFNTENAETLEVSADTWKIEANKNDGYPILNWQ